MSEKLTLHDYMEIVERGIEEQALENSEGSYYDAKVIVKHSFNMYHIPLTDRQVINIVNRVWDKVHPNTKEEVA